MPRPARASVEGSGTGVTDAKSSPTMRFVMKIDDAKVVTPLAESQQKADTLFFLQDGITLYSINSRVSGLFVMFTVGIATGMVTVCLKKLECTTKSTH